MAAILRGVIATLLISIAVCELDKASPKYVTVDAAYSKRFFETPESDPLDFLWLFMGKYVQVLGNRKFERLWSQGIYEIPANMTLKAAVQQNDTHRIYYGEKNFLVVDDSGDQTNQSFLEYGTRGGPDAATHRGEDTFLFFGCNLLKKGPKSWKNRKNLQKMGLPCEVDAAWSEGNKTAVLKGDQLWWWKADGSVEGSVNFADLYTLAENWVLKPSDK